MRNTWSYDEMFPPTNNELWNVTEFISYLMGRCYSFKMNKPVKAVSLNNFIQSWTDNDMNVYAHQDQEDFWLWFLLSPTGFASETVPNKGNVDLHNVKKEVTIWQRKDNCKEYGKPEEGFIDCAKEKIKQLILEEIPCTTVAIDWLFKVPEKMSNQIHPSYTIAKLQSKAKFGLVRLFN